jgi:hypothetical protein
MSVSNTSKAELIADAQKILGKYGKVTRELYRKFGLFSESQIKAHFETFTDLVRAIPREETQETEQQTFHDDKWDLSLITRINSLDELVKQFKVDLGIWKVERFVANSWEMGYKNKEGDAKTQPLYQVKATFVKKQNIIDAREEIEDLKKAAKSAAHMPPVVVKSGIKSNNCLELLIPDLHAGKFSWSKETLHPDYDTPTAIETFERAVQTILERAQGYVFEEILLCVGNDLLNSDDYNSQTTKGTLVNSDTRYQKTYKAVREMMCRTIERLRSHCVKVVVKTVPGNHDTQSTFTLGDSLECYFKAYDDVVIDNAPSPHKFYRWGKVLLGFTHGDTGKKADYGLWMATERPQDFGETLFREIHIGHTHGLKVDEKFGVRVRTFSALCPPDAWHAKGMFVGNLRQAEAIVWNKELGRIAEFIHTEID